MSNTNKPADKINHSGQLDGKMWKVLDKISNISLKFSALLMLVIILAIWYQVFARFIGVSTVGTVYGFVILA